jgi:hypothetical protein
MPPAKEFLTTSPPNTTGFLSPLRSRSIILLVRGPTNFGKVAQTG